MSGIAGVSRAGEEALVGGMLDRMAHRGRSGRRIVSFEGATLGAVWPACQHEVDALALHHQTVRDGWGDGHLAQGRVDATGLTLERDALGLAPLYYGELADGTLCFASEVKALLGVTVEVREFPPGHRYGENRLCAGSRLSRQGVSSATAEECAAELRSRLAQAIERRIGAYPVGSWLSGGLDSSSISALARTFVPELHTFCVGFEGAADLHFARLVADHIHATHHELVVTEDQLLAVMPEVVYHLESFDALLVRSSLTNYLVGKLASEHVPTVFSGEAGDEMFAGYAYLKSVPSHALAEELIDIANRLHNTAFQRVDRCSAAHGLAAHVPFSDPGVVDYALRIPVEYKLRDGVEKWILRRAMADLLPAEALARTKAKFWEGAGVGERIAERAAEQISDHDFYCERTLPCGWVLNSKEELLYYRAFRERFGEVKDLTWMGRTKGVPRT